MNDLQNFSTDWLLARIESWQAVQKTNPPSSEEWQQASTVLHVLYAEMSARTAA